MDWMLRVSAFANRSVDADGEIPKTDGAGIYETMLTPDDFAGPSDRRCKVAR